MNTALRAKGPWTYKPNHMGDGSGVMQGPTGGHICEFLADPLERNAHLMAAAPDLLAALQDVMPMLERCYQAGNVVHPYLAAARAAIAKATGGNA